MKPEIYIELKAFIRSKLNEGKNLRNYYSVTMEAIRRKLITPDSVCEKCQRKNNLSIDHIVPFTLLEQFGLNAEYFIDEENFAVLCRGCNGLKSARLDFSNPKTKPLLQKYVALIE